MGLYAVPPARRLPVSIAAGQGQLRLRHRGTPLLQRPANRPNGCARTICPGVAAVATHTLKLAAWRPGPPTLLAAMPARLCDAKQPALVRGTGLEPVHLAAAGFKPATSTDSVTRARLSMIPGRPRLTKAKPRRSRTAGQAGVPAAPLASARRAPKAPRQLCFARCRGLVNPPAQRGPGHQRAWCYLRELFSDGGGV